MTYEEAIEILQEERDYAQFPKYAREAIKIATSAIKKQIPEKPKLDNDNGIYETEHCPNCNRKLFPNEHHCKCGQALDWSDTK